jgi:pimeloyl-ACP methyl ester carboxylesterase
MASFDHRTGRIVEVDGAALFVEETGDPAGSPVLFLHGGLGSIDDFARLIPLLPDRYRLVGVDARGHGRSTLGSIPLTYGRLERDVVAVLDDLDLGDAPVDLVGFSDGGVVGYRLAAHHPDRIRSLTTIGADWRLPAGSPLRARLGAVTPASWRERFPDSEAEYLALNPEPDFDGLIRACVQMWVDTTDSYPNEEVDRIACPLTIVRGTDDPLAAHDAAVELAGRVPRARLHEIDDAGHAVAATKPEALAEILIGTLD